MTLEEAIHRIQERHAALGKAGDTRGLLALERDVHRLLNIHPGNPHLLYSLGLLHSQTDRSGCGIALLERARDEGLDGPQLWTNLGAAYKQEHKDASAAACYEKAIEQCREIEARNAKLAREGRLSEVVNAADVRHMLADAMHGMASLYVNAGKPEKIIEWADKALAINPDDRYALWNRGLGYLESGQWAKGWEAYDVAGFMVGDNSKPIERKLKTYGGLPRWDGEKGKTVICYGEQGRGDEEMFASMLPDLMKDCRVIIDCDPRLEAVFRRSFPQAEAVYPTSEQNAPFDWIANHKVDAYVPMGSLGRYYRPSAESFPRKPYLKPDAEKVAKWGRVLGTPRNLRIAISWAGGLKKTRFDQRTIPLLRWADILRVPGIDWYSLQYHSQAADEAAHVGQTIGVPVHHWGDVVESYEETAGFLQHMDLVITVNTSLLHTCGAMGIETWCLTPVMCAWRYQCKGPHPFYGSVEMLRQEKAGDWKPVLETVRDTLRKLTNKQEAA